MRTLARMIQLIVLILLLGSAGCKPQKPAEVQPDEQSTAQRLVVFETFMDPG